MNKYIKIAVVTTLGLILTGCGEKKITCSYKENSSFSGDQSQEITYVFSKDGKKIEKYIETLSVKYTDKALKYYDEDIEDVVDEAEEDCEDYEDADFITCKVTSKGNKITQTITYDLKKLDEDDLEDIYDDEDISYSIYTKTKKMLDEDYEDIKDDYNDDDSSLYKYSCR